jgi:type II secretory pathway pseudopilin PulG
MRFTPPQNSHRCRRRALGFTLIEAAMTTAIIGIGVVALLELLASGTRSNVNASELVTATNLAKQFRERTLQKTFDQVRAMNGLNESPPKDAAGNGITQLNGWEQSIKVNPVDPARLSLDIIDSDPTAIRVTVTISHNKIRVSSAGWIRFK